jgi:DNA-directed RNA polymerase specialized sigma24 family protein
MFDLEDIKQEARLFALEALPRYDPRPGPDGKPTRPLENFVCRHVKNRLLNMRRNLLRRADPPCSICHRAQGGSTEHPDGQICKKYAAWKKRNDAKASLMSPSFLDTAVPLPDRGSRRPVEDETELKEMLELIDRKLDIELRGTYLQMRAGRPVSQSRRKAVVEAVREILGWTPSGRP